MWRISKILIRLLIPRADPFFSAKIESPRRRGPGHGACIVSDFKGGWNLWKNRVSLGWCQRTCRENTRKPIAFAIDLKGLIEAPSICPWSSVVKVSTGLQYPSNFGPCRNWPQYSSGSFIVSRPFGIVVDFMAFPDNYHPYPRRTLTTGFVAPS